MNRLTPQDIGYLKIALSLAKKGLGRTFPNPMVGAVIVKSGQIISQGYHCRAGRAHAEIKALLKSGSLKAGATLYVNLEPCSHYGKTPPCVEAIIKAKITRVVCCTPDPNPKVCGQGIRRLRQAGVKVAWGGLVKEAKKLNEAFFTFHQQHRPLIAIKFAASLDGKIATASYDSHWITNEQARDFARNLRSQYQAVLVGINTVLHDNPRLGGRAPGQNDPLRIILDSALRLPLNSQVLRDNNVLIITTRRASRAKYKKLINQGVLPVVCHGDFISLKTVMAELVKREIVSVFVEGGSTVLGSFVDAGLVDKVYAFYAPILIGGKAAINAIGGQGAPTLNKTLRLTGVVYKTFGDNILISGDTVNNNKK